MVIGLEELHLVYPLVLFSLQHVRYLMDVFKKDVAVSYSLIKIHACICSGPIVTIRSRCILFSVTYAPSSHGLCDLTSGLKTHHHFVSALKSRILVKTVYRRQIGITGEQIFFCICPQGKCIVYSGHIVRNNIQESVAGCQGNHRQSQNRIY